MHGERGEDTSNTNMFCAVVTSLMTKWPHLIPRKCPCHLDHHYKYMFLKENVETIAECLRMETKFTYIACVAGKAEAFF